MRLHDAIAEVLHAAGRALTSREIADEVNRHELYRRKDGAPVPPSQISARVPHYPDLFSRTSEGISLLTRELTEGGELAAPSTPGFLLTWNPANVEGFPVEDQEAAILATGQGEAFQMPWSTGGRTSGIEVGDRAFLLKQGAEPRGMVGVGTFASEVYQGDHWDRSGRLANYAEVEWQVMLDAEDPLLLEDLKTIPGQNWQPMGSGTRISPENVQQLDRLWRDHLGTVVAQASSAPTARRRRQGWILNAELRKQIEDAAQDRLMSHFRNREWVVRDTRYGNSFDAIAEKDGETIWLEAKGTISAGESVIVSRGEVAWAREHRGRCVLGLLSDIEVEDGVVVEGSGTFRLYWWDPDQGELDPSLFDWTPGKLHPEDAELGGEE